MMKPQKKKKTPVGQMQAGGPTKQAPRRPAGKLPPAGTGGNALQAQKKQAGKLPRAGKGGNALQAQKKQAQMLGRPSRRPEVMDASGFKMAGPKGGPTKQAPRRGSVKSPGGPIRSGTGGGAATPSRRSARSPLSAQKAQVAATGGKRTAAQQQRRKARLASMTPAQRQRRKANMKTLQGMTPAQRRQRRPVGRRK